jgi:hypothetical protein
LNKNNINQLNTSIPINESKVLIKSLLKQKIPGPNGLSIEFFQTFKKLKPMLLKLLHEIEREGTLSNLFYEDSITLIPKPFKEITRKKKIETNFLMNMDTKMLNKLFGKKIQQHVVKIIHHG